MAYTHQQPVTSTVVGSSPTLWLEFCVSHDLWVGRATVGDPEEIFVRDSHLGKRTSTWGSWR